MKPLHIAALADTALEARQAEALALALAEAEREAEWTFEAVLVPAEEGDMRAAEVRRRAEVVRGMVAILRNIRRVTPGDCIHLRQSVVAMRTMTAAYQVSTCHEALASARTHSEP